MFKKPQSGWTTVSLDTEKSYGVYAKLEMKPGYLSNVPVDVLTALSNWYTNHMPQLVNFNLEEYGISSMLILCTGEVHFVNTYCNEPPIIYRIENVDEIVDEIITDFEQHIDDWSGFYCFNDSEERQIQCKKQIQELIQNIKSKKLL